MTTTAPIRRVEHQQTDKGYVPIYTTAVVEQPWSTYSRTDNEVWAALFRRQREVLPGRACRELLENMDRFGMGADRIPRFDDLNKVLRRATGWELIAVEGLLPEHTFFEHLSHRRFPVTWWIRKPEQLDYIAEPDLFHDLFGHVPLLLNPVFADYVHAYGCGGVKAFHIGPTALTNLTRLYWYTVEFGLLRTDEGLRIYGAGIASSKSESIHSLESAAPNRLGFDLERVMRTQYRIDTFQKTYFVIDSFESLFEATLPDLTPVYAKLRGVVPHSAGDILSSDPIFNVGTRDGWAEGADF